MAKWQLGFLPCPAHFLSARFQPVMGEDVAYAAIECIRKNLENIVEIFGTKGRIKIFQPWLTPRESKIELQNNHKKIIMATP